MSKEELDKVYNEWIGKEVLILETDEVVNRLRDLMEAEIHPIADCPDCARLGKVCYENDGGFSHRLSQGTLTARDLRESIKGKRRPLF